MKVLAIYDFDKTIISIDSFISFFDWANKQYIPFYKQKKKDKIFSNWPKDIYFIETKGVCPGGREVTLTNEEMMPG